MPEPTRKRPQRNAGAFIDPQGTGGGAIPIPMSTLSDEYHDEPTEPEDSDRVPEPQAPSLIRRIVEQLFRRPKDGDHGASS